MNKSRYNFKDESNKSKSCYKLFMVLKESSSIVPSYISQKGDRIKILYSYYKKNDCGYEKLRAYAESKKNDCKKSIIYERSGTTFDIKKDVIV